MTRRRLKILLWLLGGGLLVLGVSLFVAFRGIPSVKIAREQYPSVRYRGPKVPPTIVWGRARPSGWVPLASLPRHVQGAVIVAEDSAFYSHGGFDWTEIRRAVVIDLKKRKFARGASTISQQVARNLFLEKDKTIWRKFKEMILTVALEKACSKRRILELYLNVAEFGRGLYGIGPASRYYFRKGASDLAPNEAAFLAMLLPSPVRYSLSFHQRKMTPKAERKVDKILTLMVGAGYLTREEGALAKHFPLPFERTIELIEPEEGSGPEPAGDEEL